MSDKIEPISTIEAKANLVQEQINLLKYQSLIREHKELLKPSPIETISKLTSNTKEGTLFTKGFAFGAVFGVVITCILMYSPTN